MQLKLIIKNETGESKKSDNDNDQAEEFKEL